MCKQYIEDLIKFRAIYDLTSIYNFDETRFDWEPTSKYTYKYRGASRIKGIN